MYGKFNSITCSCRVIFQSRYFIIFSLFKKKNLDLRADDFFDSRYFFLVNPILLLLISLLYHVRYRGRKSWFGKLVVSFLHHIVST